MRHKALVGKQVAGRFTIRRFLGEGGMATVYVAEQAQEPREVALKIMNQELTKDRSFVKRFQREAQASSRVNHPCSVHVIDYGVADGLSYIAMELLIGDDLYALLEREGSLTQARAARILVDVCDALMVAHELGIVHRDLKPENIMVIPDPTHPSGERVKVLDFGIAKLLVADHADEAHGPDARLDPPSAVTRAGTFIGTPAYMSPEQCALLAVDTRADIYTCGVLLFQLVTGQLPFEGQSPLHTATLHIHQPPPKPSSLAPGLDPRLEALILKALEKRPADRYQTALHLAATLRKILVDLPETRVGFSREEAEGAGSVRHPAVPLEVPASMRELAPFNADAGRAALPPTPALAPAPFPARMPAPPVRPRPSLEEAPEDEAPDSSTDGPRTLVRSSWADVPVPTAVAFSARSSSPMYVPPTTPAYAPPPAAPTFGAPPLVASSPAPQRGAPAPFAPPAYAAPPAPPTPPLAAPPPHAAPFAAAPSAPFAAPSAPFAAPIRAEAGPASSMRGSRGLAVGLALGLTIVALMAVAYLLLLR